MCSTIKLHTFVFSILSVCYVVHGINFHLQPNTQKCLREELNQHTLINGEYTVVDAIGQSVDYVVTDSKGHIFSQGKDITHGKFSFTTDTYETYEICFISKVPTHQRTVQQEIRLDIKTGVEAKSYDNLAEATKLKPMEIELKRLEELSDAIVQDFVYMKEREEEMRNTNESTNNRVFYLSIFSIIVLIGLAAWQILYLRQYFKSKKLIE